MENNTRMPSMHVSDRAVSTPTVLLPARNSRAQNYPLPRSLPYPEHDRNSTVQKFMRAGKWGGKIVSTIVWEFPPPRLPIA